jgi:hypothetical protein
MPLYANLLLRHCRRFYVRSSFAAATTTPRFAVR